MRSVFLVTMLVFLNGCGTKEYKYETNGSVGSQGSQGAQGIQGYGVGSIVSSANTNQCGGNGGSQVSMFQDQNNDSILNGSDYVTSQFLVCNGKNGTNGNNGTNGSNGQNGTNGTSSSVSVSQASHTQCANGGIVITTTNGAASSSNVVCNGTTGPQGQQGPAGLTGLTGLSGLSMVQFCPGVATTYPSKFPEFGMCVSGKLYAVYWDNKNSWLAEVVPGCYSSTSTSAPCNFTVTSGCNVSH